MSDCIIYEFQKIEAEREWEIAWVTLNRPEKANALNEDMIQGLHDAMHAVENRKHCRLLILGSRGKNFCAGADLNWMRRSAELSYDENVKDAEQLGSLLERLRNLKTPSLALVQGHAAGGALGLLACCDLVLVSEDAHFSLREVRVGLLPAMILPYLMQKMAPSALRRFGLTGESFDAREAHRIGLVSKLSSPQAFSKATRDTIQALLDGAPGAQSAFKELHDRLGPDPTNWDKARQLCVQTIARTRTSEEGQRGLSAFLKQEKPHWVQRLPENWMLP